MAAAKKEVIEIKPLKLVKVPVTLVGDTPLIMHSWSEKAKKEMLDGFRGKKSGKKKDPKNPIIEFIDSMYWLDKKPEVNANMSDEELSEAFMKAVEDGARFGFPATSFKKAACSAAYRMGWTPDKVSLYGVFWIDGDEDGFVEIKSDPPIMREDPVKVRLTNDLRYRGEFRNWSTSFTLTYNANGAYSIESILSMLNAGGCTCGVGEWRVEKSGDKGMFHVQSVG